MKKRVVIVLSLLFLSVQIMHAFCTVEESAPSCHSQEQTADTSFSCEQKCCATISFVKSYSISTCEKISSKIYSTQNLLDTSVIIQLYKPPKIS